MPRFSQATRYRPLIGIFLFVLSIGILGGTGMILRDWTDDRFGSLLKIAPPAPETTWKLEIDQTATPPAVTARAYWIYERNSQSLLASQADQTATSVASLAKLMTALVSYDTYALDTVLPVGSASAVLGNRAKFYSQDHYRVYDLLQALLIFSANDAAETLALNHPAGRDGFISDLNAMAAKLELQETSFENPSGLDDVNQRSSARDLGAIANAVLDIPTIAQMVSKSSTTIREQKTGRQTIVYSTNALLSKDPRYQGVKTGTTDLSGESLIVRFVDPVATSSATPQGTDLLLVILGSEQRFIDAQTLVRWVQDHSTAVQRTLQ